MCLLIIRHKLNGIKIWVSNIPFCSSTSSIILCVVVSFSFGLTLYLLQSFRINIINDFIRNTISLY